MKETRGTPKLFCELSKSEFLFFVIAFANAPKSQRIGSLPRPPLNHIAGEIEVGWNRVAH
jgi:hypothetical protein